MFVNGLWGAAFGGLCGLMWHATETQAAMTLGQTRVIVTAADKNAVVQVHNRDNALVLLQLWIDDRNEDDSHNSTSFVSHVRAMAPATVVSPFIVEPPVMRLAAGQSQSARVSMAKTLAGLPTDRESLYWFNALAVPAHRVDDQAGDHVGGGVLTRLKLFYRPAALAGIRHRESQNNIAALRFELIRDELGWHWLRIHNPAPIHQSLARLTLVTQGAAKSLETPMVAPFASTRVRLPGAPRNPARLAFATLDDDGNLIQAEAALTPSYEQ